MTKTPELSKIKVSIRLLGILGAIRAVIMVACVLVGLVLHLPYLLAALFIVVLYFGLWDIAYAINRASMGNALLDAGYLETKHVLDNIDRIIGRIETEIKRRKDK